MGGLTLDFEWEREFLANTVTWAQRTENIDPSAFAGAVLARLDGKGAVEYGESWTRRSWQELFGEGAEEPPDGVAWTMLALQAIRPQISDDDFQGLVMDAQRAAVYLAAADNAARGFARKAAELTEGP